MAEIKSNQEKTTQDSQYDFNKSEKSVLAFWKNEKIYEKIVERNRNGKKFYWLQGPPYTSGALHSGQAWNHSLKDMVMRYRRMQGYDVWDRNGYDMHGLPTAHKVMEKYNLKNKEDIVKFGLDKFNNECYNFSLEKANIMTEDLKRFGVWLNYNDPYMPITNEFIESEWWLIKQAHKKGRLYEGKKALTWCYNCETVCAKHELQYKNVEEDSVYIKYKLVGKENEFLIVWTTTPWTLPLNEAVMVNPELDYVRAEVKGEIWIIAKGLAGALIANIANIPLKITEEFKGDKLEGLKYRPVFEAELGEKYYKPLLEKSDKMFSILLSEIYVDLSAGSGLVHTAGGCGPEDAEVCIDNKIPPLNPITEDGYFPKDCGALSGLHTKKDTKKFIDLLKKKGVLLDQIPVEHEYAHCERCNNPVIFRLTDQWFFKMEDLKEKMLELNSDVHWVPETAKNNFNSWLKNLRDNSITKQNFWGTPVPIWRCVKCKDYLVIESGEELKKLAGKIPENFHIPWIDEIKIPCKCGGKKERIKDILDVWIDAGIGSWNCLYYPKRKDLFDKYFPIDFIVEGKDQIRGWFNVLFVASMIAFDTVPYRNVHMHGFITDVEGEKMSKSIGNIISPYEIVEKYGADTMRYYFSAITAGEDLNFSWDEIKLKHKNLLVLWNTHKFLIDLAKNSNLNPRLLGTIETENFGLEEKYIISRLHSAIKKATEFYESYDLDKIIPIIESLFLDLSRTYIQLVREKSSGSEEDKSVVCYCIYTVFLETLKMLSTVCPFITETAYQNMKDAFGLKEESIHNYAWPKFSENQTDKDLESLMETAQSVITAGLAAREKAKTGRRWPVKEFVIISRTQEVKKAVDKLSLLILQQLNAKTVKVDSSVDFVKEILTPNYGSLGKKFGGLAKEILEELRNKTTDQILKMRNSQNIFELKIKGKKIDLLIEDFNVERQINGPYKEIEFRQGIIYVNTEQSSALLAEGFSREIIRNIQEARKTHGLQKVDEIELYLKVPAHLLSEIKVHSKEISQKTGCSKFEISDKDSKTQYEHGSEFKIKEFDFAVKFNRLGALS